MGVMGRMEAYRRRQIHQGPNRTRLEIQICCSPPVRKARQVRPSDDVGRGDGGRGTRETGECRMHSDRGDSRKSPSCATVVM